MQVEIVYGFKEYCIQGNVHIDVIYGCLDDDHFFFLNMVLLRCRDSCRYIWCFPRFFWHGVGGLVLCSMKLQPHNKTNVSMFPTPKFYREHICVPV